MGQLLREVVDVLDIVLGLEVQRLFQIGVEAQGQLVLFEQLVQDCQLLFMPSVLVVVVLQNRCEGATCEGECDNSDQHH